MLTIIVPAVESFDEVKQVFINAEEVTLELEHSLFSLSKWESTWEKPFLGPAEKTNEEVLGYVKAMTITPNIPPEVYHRLSVQNMNQINEYIDAKMSATWFTDKPKGPASREVITAEIIYYWMTSLNIPLEWEHRHLTQLFTLIKVINQKNDPKPKKMSQRELMQRNRELNAKRKAELQTRG